MLAAVAVVVVGATTAFFSDTETSRDNTFTAGAIDLKVDNESYYNSVASNLSWDLRDLTIEKFFNFVDVKPGDDGEDTISLHVNNNPSWVCADVTLKTNRDNGCTEPEDNDAGDSTCGDVNPLNSDTDGELASAVEFIWWADDGDNVLEEGENQLPPTSGGTLGSLGINGTANVTLADSDENIWGDTMENEVGDDVPAPLPGEITRYIAKAWCFGNIAPAPLPQNSPNGNWTPATENDGENGIDERDGGFTCSGASSASNITQTDSFTADISFRAVQSRNNSDFSCQAR